MIAFTLKGLLKRLGASGQCLVLRPQITLLHPPPDEVSRARPLFDHYWELTYGEWEQGGLFDVAIALDVLREENAAHDLAHLREALVEDGLLLARAPGGWLIPALYAAAFRVEPSWRQIVVARKKTD